MNLLAEMSLYCTLSVKASTWISFCDIMLAQSSMVGVPSVTPYSIWSQPSKISMEGSRD